MLIRERLAAELAGALERSRAAGEIQAGVAPAIILDVPPSSELGDFSSDLPVTLAKHTRQPAPAIAESLVRHLPAPAGLLERVEASSSGILNFHLRADWLQDALAEILERGESFGREEDLGQGRSVLLEYVSAYPTGPLSVHHGRAAALGDALGNVLEWSGFQVARETYVNDAGTHMDRFAASLEARYLQALGKEVRLPLDGYSSDYLVKLGADLKARVGESLTTLTAADRRERVQREGVTAVLERQEATLSRLKVRFDDWYTESALHGDGGVAEVVRRLSDTGEAYELEGATWLRSTVHGDDQDRALVRSNGRPSYLAGDLAYHHGKRERGYDVFIDIWNAEHAGYIRRTRAGIEALGIEPSALEILIFQPVSLKLEGEVLEGSSRAGNTIQLDDVIEEVGAEVARFFYLRKPAASPLEFDLDLARDPGPENPYVGVSRTLERARAAAGDGGLAAATTPAQAALLRKLAALPDEIRAAARERDPHRLTRYAGSAAAAYGVVEAQGGPNLPTLARAAGIVLSNTLTVLGA